MLSAIGLRDGDVSAVVDVPIATIRHWRSGRRRSSKHSESTRPCPRCGNGELDVSAYAYLLGSYLGDGHLSVGRRGVWALSIYCDDGWPGIMAATRAAMTAVLPRSSVCHVPRTGCVAVKSYSKHWPCLLPQHGVGKKHTRKIELEPWQQQIASDFARPFLRELFHSDGCRAVNRVTRIVAEISVAKRPAVATLDGFVGAKH